MLSSLSHGETGLDPHWVRVAKGVVCDVAGDDPEQAFVPLQFMR